MDAESAENEVEDEKIGMNQFYDIVTSRKPDWQTIIYELIHTKQLDPWDVDIVVLTGKYFEKIAERIEIDRWRLTVSSLLSAINGGESLAEIKKTTSSRFP